MVKRSNFKPAKTAVGRKRQQAAIRASYAKKDSKKIKSKLPPGRVSNKRGTVTVQNVPETYPHFRKYLKSGHPALIVAEYSPEE